MNSNLLRIACCTISVVLNKKGKKRPEVIARCLEYCVWIKGFSLSKRILFPRNSSFALENSNRSLVEASAHEPCDLHRVARPALFRLCVCMYVRHVSFTWCVTPATRRLAVAELRVPPRTTTAVHIINLLWLPNAIRGIHYLPRARSVQPPSSRSRHLRKCIANQLTIHSAIRIIGFICPRITATIDQPEMQRLTGEIRRWHVVKVFAILLLLFIDKRPNVICGNSKLPDIRVSHMNYRTLESERSMIHSDTRVPR